MDFTPPIPPCEVVFGHVTQHIIVILKLYCIGRPRLHVGLRRLLVCFSRLCRSVWCVIIVFIDCYFMRIPVRCNFVRGSCK